MIKSPHPAAASFVGGRSSTALRGWISIAGAIVTAAAISWILVTRPITDWVLTLGLFTLVVAICIAASTGWTTFELIAVLALLASASSDVLRAFSLGPITLLGAATVSLVLFGIMFSLTIQVPREVKGPLRGLRWFIGWALLSLLWSDVTQNALQNIAVYVVFVSVAGATASAAYRTPRTTERLYRWLDRGIFAAAGLYLASVAVGGLQSNLVFSPRGFALFAVVGVIRGLSHYRFGSRPRAVLMLVLSSAAIFASLSRTALAISVLLIPLAWLDRPSLSRRAKVLTAVTLVVGLFAFASVAVGPLRDRFTGQDRQSVGGVSVHVSGRGDFWSATLRSWQESPWIGRGPGSSEYLPLLYLAGRPNYGHPHNDYLRLLHDYGLVGMVLWVAGSLMLFRRVRYAWRHTLGFDKSVHQAAFLGLTSLALAMITDNPIVYVFYMTPLAVLVGLSLAHRSRPVERETSDGDPLVDRDGSPHPAFGVS